MSWRATLGSDSGGPFSDIRLQVGRGQLLDFDIANRATIFVMSKILAAFRFSFEHVCSCVCFTTNIYESVGELQFTF